MCQSHRELDLRPPLVTAANGHVSQPFPERFTSIVPRIARAVQIVCRSTRMTHSECSVVTRRERVGEEARLMVEATLKSAIAQVERSVSVYLEEAICHSSFRDRCEVP
jgi:hypothetical protein